MDDADARGGEKHKRMDDLLGEFAHEVERHAAEVGVADKIIEVE
jgi:hypothetical protein